MENRPTSCGRGIPGHGILSDLPRWSHLRFRHQMPCETDQTVIPYTIIPPKESVNHENRSNPIPIPLGITRVR